MNSKLLRIVWLGVAVMFLAACGPKHPDKALILWEQPSPAIAANAHANERPGLQARHILPTGSMEPYLTGGDWIVVDTAFSYDAIKAADLLVYQARWLPKDALPTCHMAAARIGNEWIMDGINNAHYEREKSQRMGRAEFRGKVIQVYTKRPKP